MPKTAVSMDMTNRVGAEIRQARQQLDITQTELAHRLGVTPSYITNIEAGRNNLTIGQLANISAALGTALEIRLPIVKRHPVRLRSSH